LALCPAVVAEILAVAAFGVVVALAVLARHRQIQQSRRTNLNNLIFALPTNTDLGRPSKL
jgi:hypothetical protein